MYFKWTAARALEVVVNAKYNTKYSAKYGNYANVDTEFVSEEVDTQCNVKEISTRYCNEQAKECPINPSISLDY